MIARGSARTLALAIGLIAVTAIVVVFVQIDGSSHSVSDTLIGWVPVATVITAVASAAVLLLMRLPRR